MAGVYQKKGNLNSIVKCTRAFQFRKRPFSGWPTPPPERKKCWLSAPGALSQHFFLSHFSGAGGKIARIGKPCKMYQGGPARDTKTALEDTTMSHLEP